MEEMNDHIHCFRCGRVARQWETYGKGKRFPIVKKKEFVFCLECRISNSK